VYIINGVLPGVFNWYIFSGILLWDLAVLYFSGEWLVGFNGVHSQLSIAGVTQLVFISEDYCW